MRSIHRQTVLAAALAFVVSGSAVAAEQALVDNVYGWGSWELGIEPASGGPIVKTSRAARVKQKNMQFRPNSNGSFTSNRSSNVVVMTNDTGPSPAPTPPAPVSPPGPSQPLGPGNPSLGGNPVNF